MPGLCADQHLSIKDDGGLRTIYPLLRLRPATEVYAILPNHNRVLTSMVKIIPSALTKKMEYENYDRRRQGTRGTCGIRWGALVVQGVTH